MARRRKRAAARSEVTLAEIPPYRLVRLRQSSSLYVAWNDAAAGQRRVKSLGTSEEPVARIKFAEFVSARLLPRPVAKGEAVPSSPKVCDLIDRYMASHGSKVASAEANARAAWYCRQFWKDRTLAELSPGLQDEFRSWLKVQNGGLRDSYVSRVIVVLRAALRRALKRQEITTMPFIFDLEQAERTDEEYSALRLEIDEMARLLEAITSPHVLMFSLTMMNAMCRPDAAIDLNLRNRQVDFRWGRIALNPPKRRQSKKYRPIVPMTETLRPWLLAAQEAGQEFAVEYRGQRLGGRPRAAFETLRERCGFGPGFRIYTLRHSVAVEVRRRSNFDEVDMFMGHRRPAGKMGRIYMPDAPEYLMNARAGVDAYFADLQAVCKRRLLLHEAREGVFELCGNPGDRVQVLLPSGAGESNGQAALSNAQVREIRKHLAMGETGKAVARQFNVSEATVSKIRRGRTWKAVK